MPVAAKYARILIDQYELTTQTNQASVGIEVPALDVTAWQADAQQFIPGLRRQGVISHGGFIATAGDAADMETVIRARMEDGGSAIVSVLVGVGAIPVVPVYSVASAYSSLLGINAAIESILELSGEWRDEDSASRGYLAHYSSSDITSTGALTGVDFGAAGSAGGVAILHVFKATDGITNGSIVLESDSDPGFGTAATEHTFDVDALGAQRAVLSGTIGRYVRVNVADLGGSSAVRLAMAVAVAGITQ